MKKVISGIQPTNNITLGNYLGAIKQFVNWQDKYHMIVFVADLHALSSPMNVDNINQNSLDIVKFYIACGLDVSKVIIFRQSDIPAHTELFDIFLNHTTIGELSRMTQYKDKSSKCKLSNGTEFIPTSLLTYPVLMASDILLHDADFVIVGQDQKQHIELTRNIGERMNNKYKKDLFVIPEPLINESGSKILDLANPTKKMSKSSESHKGVIFLNEDIDSVRKKIMSSLTDNLNQVKYDYTNQPGVSNLIDIYASITNKTIKQVEEEFKAIKNYGEFKSKVADEVCNLIAKINNNYKSISNEQALKILQDGYQKINTQCQEKINQVYKCIGVK